jgi:hypothetical protein
VLCGAPVGLRAAEAELFSRADHAVVNYGAPWDAASEIQGEGSVAC